MQKEDKLKFAFGDTIVATPINFLINLVFLSFFMSMEFGPAMISVLMTGIFFCFAVIRKYLDK
jgi:hypothetical protein